MDKQKYSKEFLNHIELIKNKRARIVISHIMEHGFVSTEELEKIYGYSHPPRAARDVREAGIPLITFNVKSKEGKSIAAYKFGDLSQIEHHRVKGRVALPKKSKKQLYELNKGCCSVCNGSFEERYMQIDHRVSYQVAGDTQNKVNLDDYMLLCGSCNRAKSWSCEHCPNWSGTKDAGVCRECYWGSPLGYTHIALKETRRLDIQWSGEETRYFDDLRKQAARDNITLPDFIKKLIEEKFK